MDADLEKVVFYIPKVLKNTTHELHHSKPIKLNPYKPDESICPVRTVVEHIKATEQYRDFQNLIPSYHKLRLQQPKRSVTVLNKYVPGINTTVFSAHSTKHSTSSKTFMKRVPLDDIMKTGWGGNHHHRLQDFIIFQS